jgi:hypothetical protein
MSEALIYSSYNRIIEIATAPASYPEMLWIITPLLITLLLVEFYLGKYAFEEIGWITAMSNALVLLFVALTLVRKLYIDGLLTSFSLSSAAEPKIFVVALLIVAGVLFSALDFFHVLPKRTAFAISSVLPISLAAYFAIVIVYTSIPLELATLVAFTAVFIILAVAFAVVHLAEQEIIFR